MRWPDLSTRVRTWRKLTWVVLSALAGLSALIWRGAAAAAIGFVLASESYNNNAVNNLTLSRPGAVTSGDLLLAAVAQPEANTINTPTGWTQVVGSQLNAVDNPNLRVFYRVATESEPPSYTFTASGSESMAGGIAAFRGVDPGNPIVVNEIRANSNPSTGAIAASVTPATLNSMLVAVWATQDAGANGPTLTVPSGMTRVVGASMMGANAAETRLTMAYEQLTAGSATGTRTASLSSSWRSNTATLALRTLATTTLSGTVFEDSNYGGGSGRSLTTSGGNLVAAARVELYDSAGAFLWATTTAADGTYSFTGIKSSSVYYVRAVSSSVRSTRSGSAASLVGVLTYRTTASTGTAVPMTDYVGGADPSLADPGAAGPGAVFDPSTGIYSAGMTGRAQAVSRVATGNVNISGLDFGFNFNTVVNTNDGGQGSLRQAITNANALGGDSTLAQSGRAAGMEHLVFMISNGTSAAGLRNINNAFSGAIATIALTSALPAISSALVLDAQKQPGWTANPIIELNGGGAGNAHGLNLTAAGSTVNGWIINRFMQAGVSISGAGSTIRGNWIGLTSSGVAGPSWGNKVAGVVTASANNVIGGVSSTTRNVISGNGSGAGSGNAGILLGAGASGQLILGNYVGLDATGATAVPNLPYGIDVGSTGNVIGGSAAGAGNVVSGHTLDGLIVRNGANANTIQGNVFGGNATNTANLGNGRAGVNLSSSNNTLGGISPGQGNVIRGNAQFGMYVFSAVTGNAVLGNSIFGNGGLGIDLVGANGINTNDGGKTAGQPNLLMDYPIFTSAATISGNLSITGYVGSAAGQSIFASSRVEVFVSDGSNSNGQGKAYVGFLTTDPSGNFAGTLPIPTGVAVTNGSSKLTGTATDSANNTSEFGPNFGVGFVISGTVFEDLNYGGGSGRATGNAGGWAPASNGSSRALLELYDGGGVFVTSVQAAADGSYALRGAAAGTYQVRLVTGTTPSSRAGWVNTLRPVLTYRTNFSGGVLVNVTDHVGGANPALPDAAANSGSQTLAALTTASAAPQAVSTISVGTADVVGVDFGISFDVVSNTAAGGAGSLAQAITNARTLKGDASLAQSGRPVGIENLVFMISNGSTGTGGALALTGGLRASNNYFTTATAGAWVATIAPASSLPAATADPIVIDAQAQPGWAGRPLVEISGASAGVASGLTLPVTGSTVRGLIINRFSSGFGLYLTGNSHTIQGCWIGLDASGTAAAPNSYGINVFATGGHLIGGTLTAERNVISGNVNNGLDFNHASALGSKVQGNYIGTDVVGNVPVPNGGRGISITAGNDNNTLGGVNAGAGNLVQGNGGAGIFLQSSGNNLSGNNVRGNGGKGVVVASTLSTGNAIRANSIYGNGGLGIDLGDDGVTTNDGAKTSSSANQLMDSPVFTNARASGRQLVVAGYVGRSPGQSLFASAAVDLYASDNDASGYGGGKTYLGTVTADGSGNFSGTVSMPVAALALGSQLSGTATDGGGNTSEFGINFSGLIIDLVVNDNGDAADATAGDGYCATTVGVCTLRAAIAERNAWAGAGGAITIAFAIPGCTGYGAAACTITPSSALPSITRSVLIDGGTQADLSSGSYTPIIEISGANAPANTTGLVVSAKNSTVRGLTINRFSGNGITLSGSGNVLLGMRIGLAATADSTAANGGAGIYVTGAGSTIGGLANADRNVIAGNIGAGVTLLAGTAVLLGNYLGTDIAGNDALGNVGPGVKIDGSGLTDIDIKGNTVANNRGAGIAVTGASQAQILGNSMSGNGGIGIDLGNDGVNANSGSLNSSLPNSNMNQPVVTGAGVDSTSLTVYGYIGIEAGQAAFAGARVELFKAAPDAGGYGEGQAYLGFLTADANGRFRGRVIFPAGALAAGDVVTATATDGNGNTSEFGPNRVTTTVQALTPGRFNAFDSGTPAGAVNGALVSKIAGSAASIDVIALDATATQLHPSFTGSVTLTWIDARDDSGTVQTGSANCRDSWVPIAVAGSVEFISRNRVTVLLTPPPSSTRVMRLRMSYAGNDSTTVSCSNDAFAALPARLVWIGASDADSGTAGTTRTLDNTDSSGGVVHRAGRPFTVRAQALDATGALMTGYDGSPALASAGCLLPSGCTAATLTAAPATATAGTYVNTSVSYADVGAVQLQLTDASYADADAADTAASARTLISTLLPVGRFVPDAYTLAVSTTGQLSTANSHCMAAGSGATFMGQAFGWARAPQVTVTAINAAGGTAMYWTGGLMKLSADPGLVETLTATNTGSAVLSASYGKVLVSDLGGGQARLSASGVDRFLLDVPAGTLQESVTPNWAWTLTLTDNTEAIVAGNPTLSATATQSSVAFNSGGAFYSGRLSLSPAHGDARIGFRALVHLQRYTVAGWVTLTEDLGCITVQNQNVSVESPTGIFATQGSCVAPMQSAVATQGGRAWLNLPGTPGGTPGRLTIRLAGNGAAGSSCTPSGASATLVPISSTWLLGGVSAPGPTALATWGRPQRDTLLRREVW